MEKPKYGIIWDQNGVLYENGSTNVRNSFRKVLEDHKVKYPEEMFSEKYRGTSLKNQFKMWEEDLGFKMPFSVEEFSKKAFEAELELLKENSGVSNSLRCLLDELKEKEIPMVIASSSLKYRTEKIHESLGLDKYITKIVACDDVANHEPATDEVDLAISYLGLDPKKCIVIEDSAHGIRAGNRAGCKTVGFAQKSSEKFESLQNADASRVIRSFDELNHQVLFDLVS